MIFFFFQPREVVKQAGMGGRSDNNQRNVFQNQFLDKKSDVHYLSHFTVVLCICPLPDRRTASEMYISTSLLMVLPGLLMYMWMGLLLLSDCRKSSWAITRLATESSI